MLDPNRAYGLTILCVSSIIAMYDDKRDNYALFQGFVRMTGRRYYRLWYCGERDTSENAVQLFCRRVIPTGWRGNTE